MPRISDRRDFESPEKLITGLVARLRHHALWDSLAVFLLFSHLACGLRAVLLGHDATEKRANRIARAVIGLGGVIALVIISAMLGVHVAGA